MPSIRSLVGLILVAVFGLVTTATACPVDRTVNLAGLDWGSAAFHNAVVQRVLEEGFDCRTHNVPGKTLPLFDALSEGDVDIMMELWKPNMGGAWDRAVAAGLVREVGVSVDDSEQGWFVPRYLVEGPNAPAPDLHSVFDLPRYKDLFADRGTGGKGQFFNCTQGWACEIVNNKKLTAYGLEESFVNVRPASGAGLVAAIASRYKRKVPFLAYYWTPTWVAGKYDLVMLEEPDYEVSKWAKLTVQDHPLEAVAYPRVPVAIAVNSKFASAAPELVRFLRHYGMSAGLISESLAYMEERKSTPRQAAEEFLRRHPEDWQGWIPKPVAERVQASL